MKWIVISIIFLVLLTLLIGVMVYVVLKPITNQVESGKRIVDKFNTDNNQYTLTEMINFHKKNEHLKKYRI